MLQFTLNKNGTCITIDISGEMTAENIETFRNELKALLLQEPELQNLKLSLTQVTFIDSMGVGLLASLYNSLDKKKAKLELIDVPADIFTFFSSIGLQRHFTIKQKQ